MEHTSKQGKHGRVPKRPIIIIIIIIGTTHLEKLATNQRQDEHMKLKAFGPKEQTAKKRRGKNLRLKYC